MTIGELRDRIQVLALEQNDDLYMWKECGSIWAKAERLKQNNIFSKVGLSTKSVKFTIRKNTITLNNAFKWQGKHCFLTDMIDMDHKYMEVIAALIEPITCKFEQSEKPQRDNLNRPIYGTKTYITFPGVLTEKYLKHEQDNPMAKTVISYILVTPKPIKLKIGSLTIIGNEAYKIIVPHELDKYKNEYEIIREADIK